MKPLLAYFTLAYLISWLIWFPLYSHVWGITGLPVLPYHHALGGLGPMTASFITTAIFGKPNGTKLLLVQMFQTKPVVYMLIGLFSPFVLAVAAAVINYWAAGTPLQLAGLFVAKEYPELGFAGFFFYNLLFFGFGEEVGWRGFALPRLQSRFNALSASLILTVLWAAWHLPLFFYRPGYTGMDAAGIFGWVFSLLTGSILLSWLYNSSKGSLLACAIFHATVDIAFLADFADKNIINYMGMLITVWGVATIVIFKPAHLSRTERLRD
ncbi:CPBP family intramembrane glutamic endopeptidase [Emticicia fluvialis]|uniref:CPBP family intramembrane glutamic endopeptidase n=1 Tax=Emticicia fluvialis TaxID=2974474 RepID=UPI0021658D65|nr:type II CAAX endopeptidase family protein [Emticicia fluvialis]